MSATKTRKGGKTQGKSVKKRAAPGRPASGARRADAPKPARAQRRELWMLSAFLAFILFTLAAFSVDGFVLEWLFRVSKGLFGVGAYFLPVAALACCLVILFARGKPVAARLWTLCSAPMQVGMLAHVLFYKEAYEGIGRLYEDGIALKSGGVLAGGLAALLSAAFSDVGTLILVLIGMIASVMVLLQVRVETVMDFFVGLRDSAVRNRTEREEPEAPIELADEFGDEPEKTPPERPKAARHEAPDMPLEAIAPVQPGPKPDDGLPKPRTMLSGLRRPGVRNPVEVLKGETPAAPAASGENPDPDEEETGPEELGSPVYESETRGDDALSDAEADGEDAQPVVDLPGEKLSLEGVPADGGPVVVDTHTLNGGAASPSAQSAAAAQPGTAQSAQYAFPPIGLLRQGEQGNGEDATEELRARSQKLTDTLSSFGVEARIVNVTRGPSVTRYEVQLDRGVKFSRLTALQDDIALALGATGVRIAPIPDKYAVGIEVPNKIVQLVYMRDVLTSREMSAVQSKLAFALGKDITGTCQVADIAKMPHLLIAGTTGSGKSVCINSIIVSILYRAAPAEVRLIMIDPKMVELGNYNGIPHLLIPVVTDFKKAAGALNWAVVEMERRYKLLFENNVRDLSSYNAVMKEKGGETLPQIVIIIDELADLMMVVAKEVEESICRIAQKARAAGMHLIIATQRPSADVLTGLMKSNIPSRISFAVASQIESRIILDTGGAEKLIGRGDMLFAPLGQGKPIRVQGCYLSGSEVEAVVDFIKQGGTAEYSDEVMEHIERRAAGEAADAINEDDGDELLPDAIDVVMDSGQASASMLQRRLKLGYARAARLIDQMESRGIIGPFEGSKPRQILISKSDWQEMKLRRTQ